MNWKFSGDRPVYQQIMENIRGSVLRGELPPGGKIPSVRDLAAQAQVNPNTMQRAMTELEREGLLVSGGTSGRTVTTNLEVLSDMKEQILEDLARECAEKFMVFGITPSQAAQCTKSGGADQTLSPCGGPGRPGFAAARGKNHRPVGPQRQRKNHIYENCSRAADPYRRADHRLRPGNWPQKQGPGFLSAGQKLLQ